MLIALYKSSFPQGRFQLLMISDEGISCIMYFSRVQGRKSTLNRLESQHILSKLSWAKCKYGRIHSTMFVEDSCESKVKLF